MDKQYPDIPVEVRNWIGRQLFENVPNNIVVIDRDYRVVIANRNFKEVFGEPAGKYCYEAYKDRNQRCEQCMASHTFEDGQVRVNDETGLDRHGKPAHYLVTAAPVYDEVGKVAYVIEMSYDVTVTKSIQREYNIFFERVPCYVAVINRDLRVVRANALLRETFGETVGEHCYEVYKRKSERCKDCPALKTFDDGKSYTSEQKGIDKNGNPTHFIVSTAPLSRRGSEFSHVIEMSTDVTDVHNLSEKLVEANNFQKAIIENSLDALVALNEKGIVHIFNPAAEALFKTPARDVIGRSQGRRFVPKEFLKAFKEGGLSVSLPETSLKDASGDKIPVRFSGSVLRDKDRVIGAAGFLQDLREVKQLEKEKLENERLAAVGQTVAQLAHGIKNILTGLQGGMYVIKSGMRSGSQDRISKGWSMLERNVDRITELVKGFLSFSKGYVPKVKSTDPNAVAEEIFLLFQSAASESGIELIFEPKPGIAKAHIDPEEIHTCLANLVSNAIDACQTADNNSCKVTLRVDNLDDTVVYEVSDSGCGMDYEIKSRVFTTFFTTKGLGGTGLGLMVTRKIVQEHGGRIAVESTPGQGSKFRIEFPRRRLPKPASAKERG